MVALRPWVAVFLGAGSLGLATSDVRSQQPRRETAQAVAPTGFKSPRLDQFDRYFALSIQPHAAALPHKADAHHVAVIFDTSASQHGEFRLRALATLRSFLGKLNPADRVCLLAADMSVAAMTTPEAATAGFAAPTGKEMDGALSKLERRVPLGATDMPLAITAAIATLQGEKNAAAARAIVYFGDGMNVGGAIDPREMKQVVELLVRERIPVSSYAVGPRVDAGLLARFANHTGGVVGFDHADTKLDDKAAGEAMAAAATEVVVWPEKLELPESLCEMYPKRTPPLRADRDTILIGQGKAAAAFDVRLIARVQGMPQEFSWKIVPSAPTDDNAYLAKVVEAAQRDDGQSLATVGSAGLMEVRRRSLLQAEALRKLAGQIGGVDPCLARRLGQQAGHIDPDVASDRVLVFQPEAGKAPPGIVVDVPRAQPADEPQGLLNQAIQQKKIRQDRLRSQVASELDLAAKSMSSDPQAALDRLKLLQQSVRADTFISPELRDSLLSRIEAQMVRISQLQSLADTRRLRASQNDAILVESQRLRRELADREMRVSQWMAKFDALMDDKKFTEAESVADLAMSMAPGNPEIATAGLNATIARAVEDGIFLRRARIRGVLLTLREVEYSHIPRPDEPPVVFPPKEWWEAMTKRREQYKAVSLSSQSDAERRIMEELNKPTTVEFNEQPLTEVVKYFADMHGINMDIAVKKLEDAQVEPDAPVTKVLRGVTLKSALRSILSDLGLAYIVRDEVLLITSRDDADTFLVTKVYPVGDLVVPIAPPQSFGGGQQGAFGQQGGGGFGGGGQFGGQGGGGQGGGGQGGGGFF